MSRVGPRILQLGGLVGSSNCQWLQDKHSHCPSSFAPLSTSFLRVSIERWEEEAQPKSYQGKRIYTSSSGKLRLGRENKRARSSSVVYLYGTRVVVFFRGFRSVSVCVCVCVS